MDANPPAEFRFHYTKPVRGASLRFWSAICGRNRYGACVLAISLFPGDSALMLFLLVVGAFTLLGLQTDGLRMGMLFVGTLLALIFAPMLAGVLG